MLWSGDGVREEPAALGVLDRCRSLTVVPLTDLSRRVATCAGLELIPERTPGGAIDALEIVHEEHDESDVRLSRGYGVPRS